MKTEEEILNKIAEKEAQSREITFSLDQSRFMEMVMINAETKALYWVLDREKDEL